jgi:hypothetical protein
MYKSVADVLAGYHALEFPLGHLPDYLMDFVTEENVDEVIESLPEKIREHFVDWARRFYVDRDGTGLLMDGEPDRVPPRALRAVQDWLRRHE